MKLSEVKIGDVFKVADMEFVKFTDGDEVIVVAKDILFNSQYGRNGDYEKSTVRSRLESDVLSKVEAAIGAENVLEFETDMTALDGTKPFEDVRSKISLVTLDFYRQNRELFAKHNPHQWWWLVTVDSEAYDDSILCVSPRGSINNDCYHDGLGVRPVLRFSSSIFVSCEG